VAPHTASTESPQLSLMRLRVTGGTGVLGRALRPVAEAGWDLLSALLLPSGIHNICRDGRLSTKRVTRAAGWYPQR
jgi:hypothetical protein